MGIENRVPFPRGMSLFTRGIRNISGSSPFAFKMGFSKEGLFEFFFGKGVTIAASSHVGGGSHVYSAVHCRPAEDDFWDGHVDNISSESMNRHYEAALTRLGSVVPTPEHKMPNTTTERFGNSNILEPAVPYKGARIGYLLPADPDNPKVVETQNGVKRQEVDYKANDDGFLGSPGGGKTSLDVAYLWPAMQTGNLTVRDMAEVKEIRNLGTRAGTNMGYEVTYQDLRGRKLKTIRAKRVILAAGTLNTLKLLMQSRNSGGLAGMPHLGRNFGTNGDMMGIWDRSAGDKDLTAGLPSRGGFRLRGEEDSPVFGGGAPASSTSYPLPKWMKRRISQSLMVYGLGVDAHDGKASFEGGRFRLQFDAAGSPVFEKQWTAAKKIGERTGTSLYVRHQAATIHPMGGAGLGRDETNGVIDGNGEVFGNPGLFVTDASAFPTSLGAPPSLSIAAWSEHVVEQLLTAPR